MSKYFTYDENGKMIFSDFSCNCGLEHRIPTQSVYIKSGLLEKIPEMIHEKELGTHCVVVCDNNTYKVAGKRVIEILERAGFDVIRCVINREGEMLPDETAVGEVLLSIQPETEFLVSVGSGSVTDTTRVNATRTGLPFVAVATAPSMDGYTSVVSPLVFRKVKIHRTGVCPEIVVCDLDVLATAPMELLSSGVGDVLGKYIANADWRLGQIINGEKYCPTCAGMVLDAVSQLIEHADEISRKTPEGIQALIEALIISSMTILIIGNTRAVASIEHNIAQFWEMKLIQEGKPIPHHGSSVGVATLLVLPIFKRFAGENLERLNLEEIKRNRISAETRAKRVKYTYGEEGGSDIIRENPEDFLTWEEQLRRINMAKAHFAEIRDVMDALPDAAELEKVMRVLHSDITPEDEHIESGLLNLSMHGTKDYRTRYTLFKLLEECGLLEEYLADYPFTYPVGD